MVKERGLEGRRGRTEKAESTGNTLRLERGWEEPSSQSELIVTLRGCLCQGDFREGEGVCVAPAFALSPVWREDLGAIGHPEDCLEGKVLVADSNYSSPANLGVCAEEKLDAYIPDKNFRTRDPRFATQERWKSRRRKKFGLEDFRYQKETDEYICPNGKVLHRIAKKAIADGIIYRRYVANREDCLGCELRARCLMGKVVRRRQLSVPVGVVPGNLLKEMAKKGGYGEGAGDLSSADWDSGAGVCEYSGGEGVESIYPEGKD